MVVIMIDLKSISVEEESQENGKLHMRVKTLMNCRDEFEEAIAGLTEDDCVYDLAMSLDYLKLNEKEIKLSLLKTLNHQDLLDFGGMVIKLHPKRPRGIEDSNRAYVSSENIEMEIVLDCHVAVKWSVFINIEERLTAAICGESSSNNIKAA
jgi:hypothetical protein